MSRLAAQPSAFFYSAVRPDGGKSYGLRQAPGRSALVEGLRKERLLLLWAWQLPGWAAREQQMRAVDHAALNEQLAQLLSRGVPLVEALEVTASTVGAAAKPKVVKLREMVAAGSSFSEACQRVGGFDNVTVAVYKAAERTGDLAGAARQLAVTARRTLAVKGRAVTLMIYPAIVLSISLIVALLMMVVIVPRLGEALSGMGHLPAYTKVVMATGTWLAGHFVLLMLVAAGVLVAVLAWRKGVAAWFDRASRRIPLLKEVILAQESARFFSVMGAMTRSGVPLADALTTANSAINHPPLRQQMERLRTRLVEGGLLRQLLDQVDVLPIATRKLLVAAERSGDLEAAFNTLAGDMIDEVEKRSQRMLAVLQPALIVLMFLIIGSMLLALLIPLITLGGSVGK